jgi:CDP-diacylglycerol--inositol 3-phosphatidyltransferase
LLHQQHLQPPDAAQSSKMVHVALFVPNLIGYIRVILLYVCYATAMRDWKIATSCYILSFAGDLLDGWAARKFDQASQFGYVLDMVTDRCATTGLISILCGLYPDYIPILLYFQMADLASHWYHVYSTSTEGSGHHKTKEALTERNIVLRKYYDIYWLFAYLCAGAEFTWIALYVLHWAPDFGVGPISLAFVTRYGFAPACLMKNIVNLCQFASAAQNLAIRDMQKRKNAIDPVLRTERRAQPQGSARRQNRGRAAALGARRAAKAS